MIAVGLIEVVVEKRIVDLTKSAISESNIDFLHCCGGGQHIFQSWQSLCPIPKRQPELPCGVLVFGSRFLGELARYVDG